MAMYRFTLSIGFPTAEHDDEVELDDGLTDEEVYEEWTQWAWNYIDGGPEKIDHDPE
jgi:hypothetical protein